MSIVVINGRRYKEFSERNNTYIRQRQLCLLEKCNYPSFQGTYCKKHHTQESEQICETCLSVKDKDDFIDNNCDCKKCRDSSIRVSDDYKTIVIIENNIRYKIFKNAGKRKLCKLETCDAVSCGEYCRKHKTQTIQEQEKQCHRCLTVKNKTEFFLDNTEYEHCSNCRDYKRKQSLTRHQERREFLLKIWVESVLFVEQMI